MMIRSNGRQVPGLLRPELLMRGNGMGELTAGQTFWGVASVVSVGLSAYHGYKRNQSIGWAIVWGLLGGIAPVITPAIAVAQGFGERAR